MNYLKIVKADIANGTGFRVSLFVTGCARHCPGCFNSESWDASAGKYFDYSAKEKIFNELSNEWCAGLSLLGGEPFSKLSDNRIQILSLVKEVKTIFPEKNVWAWTGYRIDELFEIPICKEILKYIDVLVDGPFIEAEKDLSLPFRGSANQRIIFQPSGWRL